LRHARNGQPMARVGQGRGGYAEFLQPLLGQVTAPDPGILDDIAGDIGQLHRQAQVAGAVQHRWVAYPHHPRHHQPDHTGHVIAVAEHVRQGRVAVPGYILGEALQQIEGFLLRDAVTAGDISQCGEGGGFWREPGIAIAGLSLQLGQAPPGLFGGQRQGVMAGLLAVDHVIAMAAPGVQQHGTAAGGWVEQPSSCGEALRAHRDAVLGVL